MHLSVKLSSCRGTSKENEDTEAQGGAETWKGPHEGTSETLPMVKHAYGTCQALCSKLFSYLTGALPGLFDPISVSTSPSPAQPKYS